MILYHGSNMAVEHPRLSFSRAALDFGAGFYTTTDFEQASTWARRVAKWRKGEPTITTFETIEARWQELSILHFKGANSDWLDYVVKSRTLRQLDTHYDVIGGPVANDRTVNVINLYIEGTITEDIALELLLPMHFRDQWTIKSNVGLAAIAYRETIRL